LVSKAHQTEDRRPSKRHRSTPATDLITLNFNSHLGSFVRIVSKHLTLNDLYRLVFRGLEARHNMFQLVHNAGKRAIVASTQTAAIYGLQDQEVITIRIAEDTGTGECLTHHGVAAGDLALVKVHDQAGELVVAYWAKRSSSQSIATVWWKYWRALAERGHDLHATPLVMWTDLSANGDEFENGWPRKVLTERLSLYLNRWSSTIRFASSLVGTPVRRVKSGGPLFSKVRNGTSSKTAGC
jgi:hypothetical protein